MWVDLYDFACRAEWLGVGLWGNRLSAPTWKAGELTVAFQRLLGDGEEAVAMRRRAKGLGAIYQNEPGRVRAAREIAMLARQKHVDD